LRRRGWISRCRMVGKTPQAMKEEMGHYTVQGESSLLNGYHCLIGKALCYFYSRAREIGLSNR